ncbi:MAG: amidoligase family protein, partial [Clostridia bacterium]|nr:amidoligase family protein [Clostridia bacterium]
EITRNMAIKTVARYFGTLDTVHHDGGAYDAWSCKDTQGRVWKVMRDVSISASSDIKKAELVSPILKYTDLEDLQEVVRQLRHKGGVSNPEHGCGVHIHISAQGQTPQSLRVLANLMAGHEKLLAEALNIDTYRQHRYCRTVNPEFLKELNKRKPTTMSELADIWYTSHGASYGRSQHYNSSRYSMANYHAVFTHGTIEFRLFQFDNPTVDRKGGLNAGQLKAYIQFSLAITQMAKELKTASPKEQQKENKKFAMRTWLNRLGLVGEEYSTLRMVFTRRLDGNAAFRFGA